MDTPYQKNSSPATLTAKMQSSARSDTPSDSPQRDVDMSPNSRSTVSFPHQTALRRSISPTDVSLEQRRISAPVTRPFPNQNWSEVSKQTSRARVASVSECPPSQPRKSLDVQETLRQRSPSATSQLPDHITPSPATLGHFQLGDCLGRGAFGSVYRGLNWTTGETVAVKQIQLGKIPKSELGEIMSEIELLKNLKHPNIVKYKGSEKTKDFLYIILEYCENGSLQHICKRFGKFPEGLVSVYISQVLQGLIYLHDQGVIHRDIKGANILTTKDGSVKLADFGVATRTGALSDYAVVGSPYWMAPEVIDQSGATTASDIWSVGCVVVELLQGRPPYHFLAPMPALFRIVQDDCPPLPEGASSIVKDFLLHCFQKDPNLRVSARKLLRHPWMVSARKQLEQLKMSGSVRLGDTIGTTHEEAVKSVREWNKALEKPPKATSVRSQEAETVRASLQPSLRRVTGNVADLGTAKPMLRKARTASRPTLPADFSPPPANRGKGANLRSPAAVAVVNVHLKALPGSPLSGSPGNLAEEKIPLSGATPAPSLMDQRNRLADLQRAEEQTDNWDDDFVEEITSSKIAALAQAPAADTVSAQEADSSQKASDVPSEDPIAADTEFDPRTIRPPSASFLCSVSSSPQVGAKMSPKERPTNATIGDDDDYSNVVPDHDASRLEQQVRNLQKQNSVGKRLFHPDDLQRVASGNSDDSLKRPASDRRRQSSSEAIHSRLKNGPSPQSTLRLEKDEKWKQTRRALNKYSEDRSGEDYSDLFDKDEDVSVDNSAFGSAGKLQLTARLSNRNWFRDDGAEEHDPFAEVDEGFSAADLEANVARDQHARMCSFVTDLVESLHPDTSEDDLLQVCEDIDQILTDMPEMKAQLLNSHGALALIQLLEIAQDRELVTRLLGILNLIIFEDPEAQESLCLIGAIPVVTTFTTKKWPHDLRLEAAHFLFAMCSTSRLTLQFVLSCRGLRTLVSLIDEDYHEQKDLVWIGIGCVSSVLELQSPASRNDFCRMLASEGLLDPLSSALESVLDDSDDDYATEARANILQIFLIYSQSDAFLKKQVATRSVLRRILATAPKLEPESLIVMLKTVKNLSMSPSTLDEMQNANTIELLTTILVKNYSGPHGNEISNQVLNTMYNLCRLSKSRQEEAAQAGIIPQLLRIARTTSPLKQFALPVLCDFAHAGKATRKKFWQHKGLDFYLKLLEDPYWQVSALESILVWLQDETARVEEVLLQASSIGSLVCVFATSKANSFENLLDPLLKICRLSSGIVESMGQSSIFLMKLIDRLSHSKAVVRLNLLRITKMICDLTTNGGALVEHQSKLYESVDKLSRQDGAVLVRELAREILAQRKTEKENKKVRRSMSATHLGNEARVSSGRISNGSMSPPPLPTGVRASTPYRRKISSGGLESADTSASSNHMAMQERSATGAFSPNSSISNARSAAMRNLVGKLSQPRRSITPNRDHMPIINVATEENTPRIPLDQLAIHRYRNSSQPTPSSAAIGDSEVQKHATRLPLVQQVRQRRSDIMTHIRSTPSPTDRPITPDGKDNDRTMRPPSRRPIPSLPSSHRYPAS